MSGSNIVTGTLRREDLQAIEKIWKKDWRIVVCGQTFSHKILPSIKKTGCVESDDKTIALKAVEYGYLLGRECGEQYPESVEVVCRERWLAEIAREFAEKMSAANFLALTTAKDEPTFKPFDKVLVRDNGDGEWCPAFFWEVAADGRHREMTGDCWNDCIPYEGNEHLLGTTEEAK